MGNNARCFGQDLMRGEHVVGGGTTGPKTIGTTAWMNEKGLKGGCSDGDASVATGTSIFDPVLCEIVYSWFCPKGGQIIDPFAGGSVRGIVAAHLGYKYWGCDLSAAQIEANQEQAAEIVPQNPPEWLVGDSAERMAEAPVADFIFSCPPYADLEVYSDDQRDISNMPYDKFLAAYRAIIKRSCQRLTKDRFACFVVGEVRDKKGIYRNLVADTIEAFSSAGLRYYNEAILVTAVGSLPIRAAKQFKASRKIGKTHQNVLVFVKGAPRAAAGACGEVKVWEPEMGDG